MTAASRLWPEITELLNREEDLFHEQEKIDPAKAAKRSAVG